MEELNLNTYLFLAGSILMLVLYGLLNMKLQQAVKDRSTDTLSLHKDIQKEYRFYRSMIDSSREPFYALDTNDNYRFIYLNRAAGEHFSAPVEELIGMSLANFDLEFDIEKAKNFQTNVSDLNEPVLLERIHRRKDGSLVPVEITINHLDFKGHNIAFGFIKDMSLQKRIERALLRSKEKAEKASASKTDFISKMSHEMRTPLNAITGFSQLMELDNTLDEKQSEYIREISNASQHLVQLINDVLDLSKIESGHVQLDLQFFELDPLLNECRAMLTNQADEHGIQLETSGKSGMQVFADRRRLKQVLINLMSNAIKYNRENGQVDLNIAENSGEIVINICDTGMGIPEARLEELFQPFNRLGAESSDIEGTGIGLVLCQHLIELMDGRIGVESSLSEGSIFWICLPANPGGNSTSYSTGKSGHTQPPKTSAE